VALAFALFPTALGHCALAWQGQGEAGVCACLLPGIDEAALRATIARRFAGAEEAAMPSTISDAAARITRLLAGEATDHRELLAVPLDPAGWAQLGAFEREVLALTREIPIGQTRTYGELARALGQPGAARAVGAAESRNPFAPIVPCHRVMGEGGAATGFSAPGGIETKRRLLLIEARAAGQLAGDQQPLFES
jgi:methylated-DNA-[protein]-cysteine S-methyltransferase